METRKTRLALTAGSLALALALAGCGGGGSSSGPTAASGGGGGGGDATVTPDPDPTAAEQVNTLFSQANDAESDAEDALEMATEALAMAKKMAGMLDVISVAGNSMMAMDNAQAILDAETDVGKALADAEKAEMAAEAAQTAANALPADTPELESLKAEAKEAVDAAKGAIAAIEAIQKATGSGTLAAYVEMVSDDTQDPAVTPESVAQVVAKEIAAFLDTDADNMPLGTGGAGFPSPTTDAEKAAHHIQKVEDRQEKTWKEIVGSTMKMTIPTSTTSTAVFREVEAAKIDGAAAGNEIAAAGVKNTIYDYTWKGIAGYAICAADDCKVGAAGTADEGKLVGSWYFTPTAGNTKETWSMASGATTYTAEIDYAIYGYWMEANAAGQTDAGKLAEVHTYATTRAGSGNGNVDGADDSKKLTPTASYNGPAIGLAVRKEDPNGAVEKVHSGEFTATAMLSARFGDSPSLSGTISGFESGNPDAVNRNWKVTLKEITSTPFESTSGETSGGEGTDGGVWTSDAYGPGTERPVGITGRFNAHFTDGHVAGAYNARR